MSSWRRLVAAAVAVVAAVTLTACAPGLSDTGEALTPEQAETLAQARFQLSRGEGGFVAEASAGEDDAVDHYRVVVTVDGTAHEAWGELHRGPDALAVTEQIALSPETVATGSGQDWQQAVLAGSDYAPLIVLFSLVADRPENAELLRQSNARYLGTAEDAGSTLEVFRLPSDDGSDASTRIWLDDDGAIRRVDAGDDAFVIRVTDAAPTLRPDELDVLLGTGADDGSDSDAP